MNEYRVISGESQYFINETNKVLAMGYKPQGGISVSVVAIGENPHYAQAFIPRRWSWIKSLLRKIFRMKHHTLQY